MVDETRPEHPLHPHRPAFHHRQLLTQAVVAGVILASGIGIGIGGTILALQDRIVWHFPSPPPDRGERGQRPPDIVEALRTKYSLSDEQTQKVSDLFATRLKNGRDRWDQLRKIEADEREQLVQDMKGILTAEQYEPWHADYEKMMADMQNRPFWGPRGDHRGPPRGDRGPSLRRGPDSHRENWPPRPPAGPDDHRKGDKPPDQSVEINSRPGEVNAPK